jgi:hypothetical protein
MDVHSYVSPEEAARIEAAVRRAIRPETTAKIESVDILHAQHDPTTVEVSFAIPPFEYRTLRFWRAEQSSDEIERRVRRRLADL